MQALNHPSQGFSYSLLLHVLFLVLLIDGLPRYLHKRVEGDPKVVAIDIVVLSPPEMNIPQPAIPTKIEEIVPKKIDLVAAPKAEEKKPQEVKESPPVPPPPAASLPAQLPQPSANAVLSPEEMAKEEKRRKEKMKTQSLIFAGGHATPHVEWKEAAPVHAGEAGPAVTFDHSWR